MNNTTHNVSFDSLGLSEDILSAIKNAGYEKPSPIQAQAIPAILQGRDIFGCAQTGTGKTAAFALPIMQKLTGGHFPKAMQFRALILTPTRELAEQIYSNISVYGKGMKLSLCKVYGGVSQVPQVKSLAKGVDIVIATPGRLLDLYRQKKLSFAGVEYLVLDEADRMLDMGFLPDIRRICAQLPNERQSLLFSATLSPEIQTLAETIVVNPRKIMISPDKPTVDKIAQRVCLVDKDNKLNLLESILRKRLETDDSALALVFARTKHGANKLAKKLVSMGIEADAIHGNKSQGARQNALNRFKGRESKVLVATDIAARGIDVKDMGLVINYDLPEDPETYVHRIGRTARAERDGEAVSFCCNDEVKLLKAIEKFIKKPIRMSLDNPFHSEKTAEIFAKGKRAVMENQRPAATKRQSSDTERPRSTKRAESTRDENRPRFSQSKGPSKKGGRTFERGEGKGQERGKGRNSERGQARGSERSSERGSERGSERRPARGPAKQGGKKRPKSGFWESLKNKIKRK